MIPTAEALRALPAVPAPWRHVLHTSVGAARALGFCPDDALLVVSDNGQALFDVTGRRLHRDRAASGYDPRRLEAVRTDAPALPVRMSGIDGGGLHRATPDGWSVESFSPGWPATTGVLHPPGASIHFGLNPLTRGRKDARAYRVEAAGTASVAFGFSPSGRCLAWMGEGDLLLWVRDLP